MLRHICFALIVVLVGTCTTAFLHAAEDASFIQGWGNVINPDGDCTVAAKDDGVEFFVPGTAHDLAAELKRWNSPRVVSEVRGDFTLEVKIAGDFKPAHTSTIPGRTPYNGAGILLHQDDQNFVTLQRAALFRDGEIHHYLNFELRQDGQCTVSRGGHKLDDLDTFLRLERRGNKIFAKASQDRVNWFSYPAIKVKFPPSIRVGAVAINSSTDPFNPTFSELKVDRSTLRTTGPSIPAIAGSAPDSDPTTLPANVTTIQGIFDPDDSSTTKPAPKSEVASTQPALKTP